MQVWGITGLSGSGKTEAVKYIEGHGYPTFDADAAAKLVVDRNTDMGKEGFEKIYRAFGSTILDSLGGIDRKALGRKIFSSSVDRERLEAIIDPLVVKAATTAMREWKAKDHEFAFIQGSRLAEAGFHKLIAGLILVDAPFDTRVNRIVKRDSMGKDETRLMLQIQNDQLMRSLCRLVWKNDAKLKDLHSHIDKFIVEKSAKKL